MNGVGAVYTVSISGMTSSGTVTVAIPAGAAKDAGGNENYESTSTDNTVTYDITRPTVTIDQAAAQPDPTGASPINFTVVFSEPVTGFGLGDVTLSGTAGANTATIMAGTEPGHYNVAVSGMSKSGTVMASIAASVVQDAAGNSNLASTSTDNSVTYDRTGPSVTINQAVGQSDPTRSSPIRFTAVFSEPVTGFEAGDVTLGGSAGATKAVVTDTGDHQTFGVEVSGMARSGAVTASTAAGVARDAAGNGSLASTSTDSTVQYDSGLVVTITGPTSDAACTRNCSMLDISGTARAISELTEVRWSSTGSGSGVCAGTTSWSASGITIAGIEDTITVTATDSSGHIATDTLTVRVLDAGPGNAWTGMAMVSLPIVPDIVDPKIAVGFEGDRWAMYDAQASSYILYPDPRTWFNPASGTPGRGFWAEFAGTAGKPCGMIPAQDREAFVHLWPGWNLIGQPFISAVTWDLSSIEVLVDGFRRRLRDSADVVDRYAWGWSPAAGDYYLVYDQSLIPTAVGEMAPWQAYWIRAAEECDLILPAP